MKSHQLVSFTGIAVLLLVSNLFAQAPDTLWTKTYGGTSNDKGYSVQLTSDGGYIIAGCTGSFGVGAYDVYLLKTDEYGDTMWTRTFGGISSEIGNSVQQTTDGGYIIAGWTNSWGIGEKDIYLIKTNENGNILWQKTYGGANDEEGHSVQQTSDGGYIVTGYTQSFGAGGTDVYLIKTNSNGDTIWTRTFGGSDNDQGRSVQQTSDGGYIVVGWRWVSSSQDEDVYLIKTDANGNFPWEKTYGFINWDYGYSVKETSDGGYIIVGTYNWGGYYWFYLIKTDLFGNMQWEKTYGEWQDDLRAYSVQQTSDNGYIVVGYTKPYGAGDEDVYLIKTNTNGDSLWSKKYGGAGSDYGYSVQLTSDGGYIITGYIYSFSKNSFDVYLIKTATDPTGINEEWVKKPNLLLTKAKVYPTPFRNALIIESPSKVKVYDITGKFITEVKNIWDGRNTEGKEVKPGVYFLKADGKNIVKVVKVR